MAQQHTFLFTGGGTGGHVTPALALAEGIRKKHPQAHFAYVGVRGKAEESMVPKAWGEELNSGKASLYFVRSRGFPGMSIRLLPFGIELVLGILKSLLLLLRLRPKAIVATGGYVAAPILFAAYFLQKIKFLKTKIFLHEQNAVLGKMNAKAVDFADRVGVAFPGTSVPKDKKAYVGYPVRGSVVVDASQDKAKMREQARESLNIPKTAKLVFAFGGSQGARTINRGLVDALKFLLADEDVYLVHGTGKQLKGNPYNGMEDVQNRLNQVSDSLPSNWKDRYRPSDFFHNMHTLYSAADLVICRGGAGSLYEICANGVAAIAIPKAGLPGDHQAANARSLERLNALRIIYERVDLTQGQAVESVDPEELSRLVLSLLNDSELRATMVANAQQQYDPKTTDLCAEVVDHLLGLGSEPNLNPEPQQSEERILGINSTQLERLLERVRRGEDALSEEERRIALYKIDGYASKGDVTMPARACRMIGEGQFVERTELLHFFALNMKASPFTRRDAAVGMRKMNLPDERSIKVLLQMLDDRYFEAVNEALYALSTLLKEHHSELRHLFSEIAQKVRPFIKSREFDQRMNALAVFTECADSWKSLEADFRFNYFHPKWKVRKKIVFCFGRLQERGLISKEEVENELKNILTTSNGFETHFQLKQEIKSIFEASQQKLMIEEFKTKLSQGAQDKEGNHQLELLIETHSQHGKAFNVGKALDIILEKEREA